MAVEALRREPAVAHELARIKDPLEQIKRLREHARFLVDEVFDREAQLSHPPARICPACSQEAPEQSGEG